MLTLIVALAAVALSVVLTVLRYKKQKNRKCSCILLLIPVTDGDDYFERRVKSCYWEEAFSDPMSAKDIILVIMTPCANAFAARRLAGQYPHVHAVHFSSLNDYLQRNYGEYYSKTDKTD